MLYRFGVWLWGRLPLPSAVRIALLHLLNPHFLVGTSAVILDLDGEHGERVLLARHTYRREYPWDLPGGWVRRGEEPARAVAREVLEETGLLISVGQPVAVQRSSSPSRIDVVFACALVGGRFRPSAEVSAAELVPREVAESRLAPKSREFVRAARALLATADTP